MQEGVFVPSSIAFLEESTRPGETPGPPFNLLDEIDERWNALRAGNPAYFDGRICHVLGVHRNGHGGAVMHVMDCAYRFFAVQRDDFDMGVRPLGVKGLIERDGRYLMGRRSPRVAMYAGMWEFAPSGSVDFGRPPHEVIVHELLEETGLACVGDPIAIAVLFDPMLKCWEIVYRLSIAPNAQPNQTDEYPEVGWYRDDQLPADLSPVARQIAELL